MEQSSVIELIREHLNQPEYLHAILNPVPVYGLAISIIALAISLVLKNRGAQITALIIVFISAISAWPVAEFGEKGYDRVESMSDSNGAAWLDAHAQRATKALPVFYVLAGVAAVALVVPWKFRKSAFALNVITLLLAIVTLGVGGWIAYAGGQVRHKEFRYGKPSEPPGGYEKMRD